MAGAKAPLDAAEIFWEDPDSSPNFAKSLLHTSLRGSSLGNNRTFAAAKKCRLGANREFAFLAGVPEDCGSAGMQEGPLESSFSLIPEELWERCFGPVTEQPATEPPAPEQQGIVQPDTKPSEEGAQSRSSSAFSVYRPGDEHETDLSSGEAFREELGRALKRVAKITGYSTRFMQRRLMGMLIFFGRAKC